MSHVRAFRVDDIPAVADLWLDAFQREGSQEGVRSHFREVFFDHPFHGDGVESLVCEDDAGRTVGFIGALPRRMTFHGRPILAAIATQLMAAKGAGGGFTGFELVRALFSGPQQLTYSDGANDAAQRLWERMGGDVARLYSLDWTRVLRPVAYLCHRLPTRGAATAIARGIAPACDVADALLERIPLGPVRAPRPVFAEEDARIDDVLGLLEHSQDALRPHYDAATLTWLVTRAGETRGHGRLIQRVCRGPRGEPLGWYFYYAKPGGISQVLQFGGVPSAISGVLSNLFADAWREGSIAVSGQAEPRWLRELSDGHARFRCRSLGVLAHSRHPEILHALHRGDSFLTRLDGEWWLRFAADPLVT